MQHSSIAQRLLMQKYSKKRQKMADQTNNELISIGQVTVPFYEDNLLVQLGEDGEIYVALRPIVESLGLSWGSQFNLSLIHI